MAAQASPCRPHLVQPPGGTGIGPCTNGEARFPLWDPTVISYLFLRAYCSKPMPFDAQGDRAIGRLSKLCCVAWAGEGAAPRLVWGQAGAGATHDARAVVRGDLPLRPHLHDPPPPARVRHAHMRVRRRHEWSDSSMRSYNIKRAGTEVIMRTLR